MATTVEMLLNAVSCTNIIGWMILLALIEPSSSQKYWVTELEAQLDLAASLLVVLSVEYRDRRELGKF